MKNNIKSALLIQLNELRKPKEKRTEKLIPFLFSHNLNSPNIFQFLRQTFQNFCHAETISNSFVCKTLLNSLRQATDLE